MSNNIYDSPKSNVEIISTTNKTPVLVWLSLVYLVPLSLFQIFSIFLMVSRDTSGISNDFSLWQYSFILSPALFKMLGGSFLFLRKKYTTPLLILTFAIIIITFFIYPYLFNINAGTISQRLLAIPIYTILEWVIVLLIIYYVLGLGKIKYFKT